VPGDTNGYEDAFLRDRTLGVTTRVSVASDGSQGIYGGRYPALSADGRYVVFQSGSYNFIGPGVVWNYQIYLHDVATGVTALVSRDASGTPGDNTSSAATISGDGRFIAFGSEASNLLPGDSYPSVEDVYVFDRVAQVLQRASVSNAGVSGNGQSNASSLSRDGRVVVFSSRAYNLVPGDTNQDRDVFARDVWLPCYADNDGDGFRVTQDL
jgi:Tol biopolymer transport system component